MFCNSLSPLLDYKLTKAEAMGLRTEQIFSWSCWTSCSAIYQVHLKRTELTTESRLDSESM